MSEEIWREFHGYQVSSFGRVRGKSGKILIPGKSHGYLHVLIYHNGKRNNYSVHRLVAILFIHNPLNKPQVNHKNGIKDDNRVDNLEWVSASENNKHAFNTGLKENNNFKTNHPSKGKFGAAHFKSKPVLQFTKDGKLIKEWGSVIDAKNELGIFNISTCCRGIYKHAGGFKWKFKSTT